MVQFEKREFRSSRHFTGGDIVAIIRDNALGEYELYESGSESVEPVNGLAPLSKWSYFVKFRKMVKR